MRMFATEAWGALGTATVERWVEFNEHFFGGRLRPVPLVMTHTLPYGKRLAFCSYGDASTYGRTITVNVPRTPGAHGHTYALLADNGVLLHEMIHQALFEAGEDAAHASEGWRREIMRLHQAITGKTIWAGRSMTKRVQGPDGKLSKVVRINAPGPNGEESLGQDVIATWPHALGIRLGKLGDPPGATLPPRKRKARG
jgi:hypothetical protein